jgi:hypothetical protein
MTYAISLRLKILDLIKGGMGKREVASALLRERAAEFKVGVNTIWVAVRRMGFVNKNRQAFWNTVL